MELTGHIIFVILVIVFTAITLGIIAFAFYDHRDTGLINRIDLDKATCMTFRKHGMPEYEIKDVMHSNGAHYYPEDI